MLAEIVLAVVKETKSASEVEINYELLLLFLAKR